MGIKIVMTDQEASSKVLEPIPAGWYKVTISDGDLKASKSEKNHGKPYYSLERTVNEPAEFEGRKVFTNVMLFEGALYSAAQLLKALTGEDLTGGEVEFPELDELMGQEVMAKVKITGTRTVQTPEGPKTYEPRNDVTGFARIGEQAVKVASAASGQAKSGSSLLPS
jgi:hypothetical protein